MPPVLRTPICDLLGIDVPIMQAGMGGVAYGRLAAAVSNAGGLGSIGGIDITPDELDAEIRLFRTLSSRPLCVDLGFPANAPKGLADVDVPAELPGPLQQLRQELREHGVELGPTHDQAISIADNRLKLEIAACLTMGAQGAWVGTRFLATRESQAEDGFKEAVVEAGHDTTLRSTILDGLHVRQLRNRFTDVWHGHEEELSPYPVQRMLTGPFRFTAAGANLKAFMNLPAGAGSGMINDLPGAAEVLGRLVTETVEALRAVAAAVKYD
jgi:NAD(P)H-dependent flavin oxidoreductase YrpB (nitropropane dioxygenase family)